MADYRLTSIKMADSSMLIIDNTSTGVKRKQLFNMQGSHRCESGRSSAVGRQGWEVWIKEGNEKVNISV